MDLPVLADTVVRLEVLRPENAEEHLAGEDDESRRWLSPPSTLGDTQLWIDGNLRAGGSGGTRRAFGIWDIESGCLAGSIEANFADIELSDGEVNVSYVVWPAWRGRGYATRAVNLLMGWLTDEQPGGLAVIRVHCKNQASLAVPARVGFTIELPDRAGLRRFARRIPQPKPTPLRSAVTAKRSLGPPGEMMQTGDGHGKASLKA